jgi:CHAT domain-containing protein
LGASVATLPSGHAMRSLSSFYRGSELGVKSLAEDLPQLPGTLTEVEAIAKSLDVGKDDIKLGLVATETAVKQSKLDDYRIVYFATHGLVAGDLQGFTKAKAEPALVTRSSMRIQPARLWGRMAK